MAQIIDLGKIRFNWAGTYSPSTEYSYNDLVKYGPNLYAFTANTAATGVVPTNTASWTLVTEGIDYRGTYTDETLYYVNDIVIDGTNTYIVLTQHTATSSVALGNPNLEIIALGQQGLPNQTGNAKKLLTTDGTETQWTATTYLTKNYVGNAQGQGAANFESAAELTDVMSIFSSSSTDFAQFAAVNTSNGANASTDFIAYTAEGTNDSGWIDMGITSSDFSAATFGITGPHDGYIFMSAPRVNSFDVVRTSIAGGFATVTTGVAHGFELGDVVRIEGSGEAFNGVKTITLVPTPTTFRFATTAAPQSQIDLDPFGTVFKPTGNGNLVLATDETGLESKIVFAAGGFSSGRTQMQIIPDTAVHIEIQTESQSPTTGALLVAGGAGITGNVNIAGDINVQGTASTTGTVYGGTGAATFETTASLTDAMAVYNIAGGASSFAQFAVRNSTSTSSTDLIVYMDSGNDSEGWVGMGIAGSNFDDATYGITGPGDGYIFHETKSGPTGPIHTGNLVLATGDKGTENKLVFAAGGFSSGTTQMEITPGVNVHIEIPTPSTSPTTGALTVVGGVGIQGDMNIQGDVNVVGTITFGGEGTTVETDNLAVVDPLIFVGTGNQADLIDLGFIGEHTVPVSAITATVTNKALSSNVATLTTSAPHTYRVGDVVVVSSVDATFNGTYSITAVTSDTFSYGKTAGNVSSAAVTPNGSASVSARRVFDGIVRDASDGVIKFFKGAVTKPTSTVNFSEAGLAFADIRVNSASAVDMFVSGTPGAITSVTNKIYVDTTTETAIKTATGSGADFAYDAENRITAYKVSPSKRYTNITYNVDGYVSGYTEVITVGGNTTTTVYTVTVNASGNITAITQVP